MTALAPRSTSRPANDAVSGAAATSVKHAASALEASIRGDRLVDELIGGDRANGFGLVLQVQLRGATVTGQVQHVGRLLGKRGPNRRRGRDPSASPRREPSTGSAHCSRLGDAEHYLSSLTSDVPPVC